MIILRLHPAARRRFSQRHARDAGWYCKVWSACSVRAACSCVPWSCMCPCEEKRGVNKNQNRRRTLTFEKGEKQCCPSGQASNHKRVPDPVMPFYKQSCTGLTTLRNRRYPRGVTRNNLLPGACFIKPFSYTTLSTHGHVRPGPRPEPPSQ